MRRTNYLYEDDLDELDELDELTLLSPLSLSEIVSSLKEIII